MNRPHVLISGAGIAGPALALCLDRFGFEVTVVERAPALREGGQAVDFRGPVHRAVLERLDLWEPIHAHRTRASAIVLLDRAARPRVTLPAVMASGDVEILRGDLVRILYERTRRAVDYRFGEQITGIEARGDLVAVEFERGAPATFDLVIGADGLHSNVRALAFGDESRYLRHHGYRIATFALPNVLDGAREAQIFSVPGRSVGVFPTSPEEARALLIHAGGPLTRAERRDGGELKRSLRQTFAGMSWVVPRVLDALDHAPDLYVDGIATVHVESYSKGRVALLGDAAYGGTLGGQGTSLAIVGAYVLAGELARAGDPGAAFARYESMLRPYATGCQSGARRAGSFFAPRTSAGLWLRNTLYGVLTGPRLVGLFERLVKDAATDFVLPEDAVRQAPGGRALASS
ncbi:FAD-dependent monooxygenase [Sorangium sp. So ce834]|uniref:FAD-dependent monooxygenase n=1 Tax=Sorangium sp. So ce834 TaxID=3133321 RepID=UPI003F636140